MALNLGTGSGLQNMILTGDAGATAALLQTYIDARTLEVAEKNLVLRQFAIVRDLPANNSKTIQFTRFEKLALPGESPLTEGGYAPGSLPNARQMEVTTITATVEQWGDYILFSELSEITFIHDIVDETLYLLGLQAAELIHREIEQVLQAGTNVIYANGKTARTALISSDKLDTADVINAVKVMRENSAMTFDGYFIWVLSPAVQADLLKDATFVEATRYAAAERLYRGEIARYFGCVFVVCDGLYGASGQGYHPSGVNVYQNWVIGQNAYAITNLQSLKVIHHPPGSGGILDMYNQKRSIAWKCSFKAVILNQNWLLRVECAAT